MTSFPFVNVWSKLTIDQLFNNLIQYQPKTTTINVSKVKDNLPEKYRISYPSQICFITGDRNLADFLSINLITDFFTEYERISTSKRIFMPDTPLEMWKKDHKKIIHRAKQFFGKTDPYHVRLAIFSYTKESSNFRATIALSLYRYFRPLNILDISAGWGDRLIGALAYASQVDNFGVYMAFDPNTNLHPKYRQIINRLIRKPLTTRQFVMIPQPFENAASVLNEFGYLYDLVFSSIPYFDLEQYDIGPVKSSGEENQSIIKYTKVEQWIKSFLIPIFKISSEFLEVGGNLALNMEGKFVSDLFYEHSHIFEEERLQYMGIIGYVSDDSRDGVVHPIYIWRKIN